MAKIWEQENKRSKQDGQNLRARKQQISTGWPKSESKKTKDLNRMAKIWEQENKSPKQDGQNLGARKQKI